MPSARYWRIIGIDTHAGGDLELSELALYEGATRVDGSATVSSVVAPVSGALPDLGDGSFSTSVRWDGDDVLRPGFAVVWDFGAPIDVTSIGVAGPSVERSAARLDLAYSTDGLVWSTLGPAKFDYPGAASLSIFDHFDPYFESVSLLMHFDGKDGSTEMRDSGVLGGVSFIARDGAKLSVSQMKFGNSSLSLTASKTSEIYAVNPPPSLTFGTGDFTIECWFYSAVGGLTDSICALFNKGGVIEDPRVGASGGWSLCYLASTGRLLFNVFMGGTTSFDCGAPPNAAWTHLAISRSNGVLRTFLNGVQQAGADNTTDLNDGAGFTLQIGSTSGTVEAFPDYIDDLRITKGVGRYTANFTVPSRAFPDGDPVTSAPLRTPTAAPRLIGEDVSGSTQPSTSTPPAPFDIYDAGRGRIVGTVKEKNTPANTPLKRRVVLLSMPGSRAIREAWSDPISGAYEFSEIATDRSYTVVSYDHTGTYRGVVADNLQPEAMT